MDLSACMMYAAQQSPCTPPQQPLASTLTLSGKSSGRYILERQDLSRMYLAHHELESVVTTTTITITIIIIVIIIIIIIRCTLAMCKLLLRQPCWSQTCLIVHLCDASVPERDATGDASLQGQSMQNKSLISLNLASLHQYPTSSFTQVCLQ